MCSFFFFKQKTAYEMRISDWSSDVCSSDLTAGSRLLFIGGQIGWNGRQLFETDDFALQAAQALRNIVAVMAEGGGKPEHITRMTWYVYDKAEYMAALRDVGRHYREIIGRHYPAMTAVEVADLVEDRARVEIEEIGRAHV